MLHHRPSSSSLMMMQRRICCCSMNYSGRSATRIRRGRVICMAAATQNSCRIPFSTHHYYWQQFQQQHASLSSSTSSTSSEKTSNSTTTSINNTSRGNNDQQASSIKEDQSYCVNLVRERDEEAYLCGLLMPSGRCRDSYFAIRAFNVELASIKDGHNMRKQAQTTQTDDNNMDVDNIVPPSILALQLRMQWWKQAIDEIYDSDEEKPKTTTTTTTKSSNPTSDNILFSNSCWNSPVVRALNRACQQHNLTKQFLERILEARYDDLEVTRQYMTMDEVEVYTEKTMCNLLYLTLECHSIYSNADAEQVAYHAGKGIGLSLLLRATPFRYVHAGEITIPKELLPPNFPYHQVVPTYLGDDNNDNDERHDSSSLYLLSESDQELWKDSVQHVADTAKYHLQMAQQLQSNIPKSGRTSLLNVVPAWQYLHQLEHIHNSNVFEAAANYSSSNNRLKLLMLLGRTWLTGVF